MLEPELLKFTTSHEWVSLDGDEAVIGLSDFAVQALTDLVHVELPSVGSVLKAGRSFGVVESVKSANDLNSPINGVVVDINSELPGHLDWASEDPFGKGWLVKAQITNEDGVEKLMSLEQYREYCKTAH